MKKTKQCEKCTWYRSDCDMGAMIQSCKLLWIRTGEFEKSILQCGWFEKPEIENCEDFFDKEKEQKIILDSYDVMRKK